MTTQDRTETTGRLPMDTAPKDGTAIDLWVHGGWWLGWWDVVFEDWTDSERWFNPEGWRPAT